MRNLWQDRVVSVAGVGPALGHATAIACSMSKPVTGISLHAYAGW